MSAALAGAALTVAAVALILLAVVQRRHAEQIRRGEALLAQARAALEALAASEEHYRDTVELSPVGMWTADAQGNVLSYSERWRERLGLPREQLLGDDWRKSRHPDDLPRIVAAREHSFATGEPFEVEYRVRVGDGSYRWLLSRAYAKRAASGKIERWYGTTEDIESRKRAEEAVRAMNATLEQRVAERTRALEEANEALEAFTYTVSHDLRAPLRAIHGFSRLLLEEHGERLPEEARGHLARIAAATTRMDALIRDLLEYSRLGRERLAIAPIPLDDALDTALQALTAEIEAARAQIEIERPLPVVLAHPSVLAQVLQNLLANAIKFVAPGVPPRIRVSAERGGDVARVDIRDNGIGIEPTHHERIFHIFERLHHAAVYPGTGIGLAIVRKAVESMNGRVGVDSAPGRGSRFSIELPLPRGEPIRS